MMRPGLILAAMALAASPAFAADKYEPKPDGRCQFRIDLSKTVWGVNGSQGWIAYECRRPAADRLKYRTWETYAYALDLLNPPAGLGEVARAWAAKDVVKAQTLAEAMRNLPANDPSIAGSLSIARRAMAVQATPTAVSVSTGQPCACDVRSYTSNGVLECPLASATGGSMVVCRGM